MKCPKCEHTDSKVIETRASDDGLYIRRRRECTNCRLRFTTYEKIERLPLVVVKKDGSRESFDIEKIKKGILKACEKRPIAMEAISDLALQIENEAYLDISREISTEAIGELVMEKLKTLDEVAYVRFASVYRQFQDIGTFVQELNRLLTEKK